MSRRIHNGKVPQWICGRPDRRPGLRLLVPAVAGSFAGIAAVSYLTFGHGAALLIPSFGASAVLLYAACHVPMAQPRNLLGGHLLSAVAGVTVFRIWGLTWWSLALAVALAIAVMMVTDTLHPPGGATAFAAVFTRQGDYGFVLMPVAAGAIILLAVALLSNNMGRAGCYPARFTGKAGEADEEKRSVPGEN